MFSDGRPLGAIKLPQHFGYRGGSIIFCMVLLFLMLMLMPAAGWASTAGLSGSATPTTNEADIISGGKTIVITLTGNTWDPTITTDNAKRDLLLSSITAGSEPAEWSKVTAAIKTSGTITLNSPTNTAVFITLSAVAGYNISADQDITVSIPSALLANFSDPVSNNPVFTVKATPEAKLSGSITSSTSESNIVSGGKNIIISLTNATWKDIVNDATNREDFFDSLNGAISSETAEWGKVITALKAATPASVLSLSGDIRTVTVTLPTVPGYNISADQSIDINFDSTLCTVDTGCTGTITENFTAFTITSTKSTATIGGTIIPTTTEADIIAGGKTIDITLAGGNPWVTDIVSTTEKKDLLLNSITAGSETDAWKAVITGSTVTLGTPETVTITLPAAASYNISADQKITINIPPVLLADSSVPVTNKLEFTVKATPEAKLSGSIISATSESNIVSGGRTIIISLTNATWANDIINIAQTRDKFFDSLNGTVSPEATEWGEVITALKTASNPTSVISLSSDKRTVTVTLPAVPGYNISSPQSIDINFDSTLCTVDSGLTGPITENFAAFTIAPASSTATITGTITAATSETEIKNGGKTIIITLSDNKWTTDAVSDAAKRNVLVDGFTTSTDTTALDKVKTALKTTPTNIVRTSDYILTITLPAVSGYDIAGDQTVTINIPATLLASSYPINSLSYTVTADKAATVTGTATPTVTEADIATGGKTVIITLTNETWKTDIATNSSTREALINAFTSSNTEWSKAVAAMKAAAVFTRTSDKVLTITLPPVAGFNISTTDTIVDLDLSTAPSTITSGAVLPDLDKVFTINPITSQTATLSGTITSATAESDIKTGSKTIVITLKNDIWATDVATNQTIREALLSGFTATGTDSTQWNTTVVNALKTAYLSDATTVVRTSDTVVTIKLPAVAGFDIGTDITVSLNVPISALTTASATVTASPSFTISTMAAELSGTSVTSVLNSTVIQKGGKTIIITLKNATWVTDVASNGTQRAALIAGFAANTNSSEWEKVKNAILADQKYVTRSSNTVVKITLPPVSDYTASNQTITLTIPSNLLNGSPGNIVAQPTLNIGALATASLSGTITPSTMEADIVNGGKTIIITLTSGSWVTDVASSSSKKSTLLKGFVATTDTVNWNKVISALKADANSIKRTSDTILTITLPPVSDYDIIADQTINITIPKTVLTQSSTDLTIANPLTIKIPTYASKGTLEETLTNGTLNNYLETIPLQQIMIIVPKKHVSSVTFNNSILGNTSIVSVDMVTATEVATVKASVGGVERTATTYTLTDGKRKFNLGFAGLALGADMIISALDGAGNKLQSDITIKLPKGKKTYSQAPKTSLAGAYSLYQLLTNNSLLKNIIKYYTLADLTVSTP